MLNLESLSQKPLIMGVLNITPNSFSDGGKFVNLNKALNRVRQMIEEGVDLIDIGGEASNPGADPVSLEEELSRVIPIIQAIRDISNIPISIDTYKPEVMEEAVAMGASLINDIFALRFENALTIAAITQVPICIMHMNGVPKTMQLQINEDSNIINEIDLFFSERIEACISAGISRDKIILDPGIGFGKSLHQNLTILKHLAVFKRHELPLLIGVSRKRLIGDVLDKTVNERMIGGLVLATHAIKEGVKIIRTHDIEETKQVIKMMSAIMNSEVASA